MRVTFLKSAGVLIEANGSRLLCDPWLKDGAYYGAWAHVPPCDITLEELLPLDGVYITHIHPDHFHEGTLAGVPRTVPVFIHQYAFPWLREAIEALGLAVVEVPHGTAVPVGGLSLTIYGADDCDPSVCGQFFGCDARMGAERPGSLQIDSLAVISDGEHTIVNVNDCPLELARSVIPTIRERHGRPDLLLVNYVGAGPFPQSMVNLSDAEKLEAADTKREQFLSQSEGYVRAFEPKAFMPFAGTYTLAGKLSMLNPYRGCPTLAEAAEELSKRLLPQSRCVHLETRQTFDMSTGEIEGEAVVWSAAERECYERSLEGRLMDYETDPPPSATDLTILLREAGQRYAAACRKAGYSDDTGVYVGATGAPWFYRLPHGDSPLGDLYHASYVLEPYVIIRTDPRLLVWLLEGKANWQDASIGSHLEFERKPDVYDRALEFCLNSLHV